MASRFESIPRDVLQHIAFLLASSSVLEPPHHLINLLLTSSTIYRSLNISNCSHLYANIFRTKFDLVANIHGGLTDSALALELLRRCRVLGRAGRRDLSFNNSRQDLSAALRMILESRGLNKAQLSAAGFPEFILSFVRQHLSHDTNFYPSGRLKQDINALAIWLLCFTISHQIIAEISTETKEEIIRLLRPSAACPEPTRNIETNVRAWSSLQGIIGIDMDDRSSHASTHREIVASGSEEQGLPHFYLEPQIPTCPAPMSAAIIIIFALKESFVFGIPTHLPENRAVALAAQRSGPTMEDFRAIASCKTPLFVDIWPAMVSQTKNSSTTVETVGDKRHDLEFCRLLRSNYHLSSSSTFLYTPGTLTGLWEGCFMISCLAESKSVSPVSPFIEDFSCRKPMQCAISEYMCFSPHLPLPLDDPLDLNFGPANLLESEDGFEIRSRKFGYKKYSPRSKTSESVQRDPSQALDIVIMGETLQDHEQAWGGFRFVGRIRPDGLISIKREPKSADDVHLGTWIFEGRLRYGVALVGQLRSSSRAEECETIRGIFSLHKSSETW